MRVLSPVVYSLLCIPWSLASSQVPLSNYFLPVEDSHTSGNLDSARNGTDNLIFTTVASLLQQWPNTRYRNGHTIVKGVIPVGTVLYHARGNREIPQVPEWLATNVEHSYVVCPPPECWMLTFAVLEELSVVYFDGSSAANSHLGHQDSQDLVIWGEVRPDKLLAERERIDKLCEWAARVGIDGLIRMEPGFEVMLCDFSKKVTLVSDLHIMAAARLEPPPPPPKDPGPPKLNLAALSTLDLFEYRQKIRYTAHGDGNALRHPSTSPNAPPGKPPTPPSDPPKTPPMPRRPFPDQPLPPGWQGPIRQPNSVHLEAVQAAGWNNFYPGEARIKLDYTRLVSFYDPSFTSLVTSREGVLRDHHRLTNISRDDYTTVMGQLECDLRREDGRASGVDWGTITRTVMDRYTERLYILKELLSPPKFQATNRTIAVERVREHLLVMLSPYLIYGALPVDPTIRNTTWTEPIAYQCSSQLTARINPETLVRSEVLIKQGVDGVLQQICFTLTDVWVDAFSSSTVSEERAAELLEVWEGKVGGLMRWLDWPVWDICRPACSDESFCYIPTWPWGIPWYADDDTVIDMTPRCVDRAKGDVGNGR